MTVENKRRFREEALRRELILPIGSSEPSYFFDLNQGSLRTKQSLETVWNLVRLARTYADSADYGEHNAMLHLVAKKSNLEQMSSPDDKLAFRTLSWSREHHVNPSGDPEIEKRYVSLQTILEQNGYHMREIE